jgi:RNA polymerase sigma-70 factor (ECF subfamily)
MPAAPVEPAPPAWDAFIARLQRYVGARFEPDVGDDVVGDILLRLVQDQDKLIAARNPMAWVMRVAGNVVIDRFRRRASEQRAMAAYASEPVETEAAQATDISAAEEFAQCMMPLLENVSDPYCEALKLVDVDGLSQRQAAERLGLSLSAMKSRVQRGRAKLKQSLLNCCAIQLDRRSNILNYRPHDTGCGDDCGDKAKNCSSL